MLSAADRLLTGQDAGGIGGVCGAHRHVACTVVGCCTLCM